ncbi:unnamed protein product [Diatraea saccharalis]|uniref:Deacetylase sirtuin-type domain-containing protein n=1 Tax=Diatraea saccharalis TaxID=40085 RepID=A0A9N9R3Z0_9NEOP|nr:unnamed protein product [Diatraea saccharalis]
MRVIYLSKNPWKYWTKVWNRSLLCLPRKMSANTPPGKSDGEEPIDTIGPSVPPNPIENLGARLRDLDVDSIRRYLAQKLGFYEPSEPSAPSEKVLDEVNLDGIVKWIKSDKCKKIITLSGAGISTAAGIPDFRSPETGLYHNLQKYNLPEPQAIFEINFFRQNPKPFFCLAKEMYPGNFKPTKSHYFIKLLHEKVHKRPDSPRPLPTRPVHRSLTQSFETVRSISTVARTFGETFGFGLVLGRSRRWFFWPKVPDAEASVGLLLRHYTQNIDTLERRADLPDDKIVEAHGTFFTSHCLDCRKEYTLDFVKERIFADEIPICTECPGVVKPDIVFFGESLPERFQRCLPEDFQQCDMLIIMGSSLEVQPFASLVDMVPDWCPRLLINREKAGVRSPLLRLMGLGGGLQFDEESTRDVALLGDCDDGCQVLADRLGWGDELRALVAREHERLDMEGGVTTPGTSVSEPKL